MSTRAEKAALYRERHPDRVAEYRRRPEVRAREYMLARARRAAAKALLSTSIGPRDAATTFGGDRLRSVPVIDRWWSKVSVPFTPGGCWEWVGARSAGYGRMRVSGFTWLAHVLGYQELVGPVPAGLQLDHLCRNRACVRPDHLEPVTAAENMRRMRDAVGLLGAVAPKPTSATACPS